MAAGGYHHHLGTNTWSSGGSATDGQARLLSWELSLPGAADGDAAARSMTTAGFPARHAEGVWEVADPWGTTLRIVARERPAS